MAITVDNKTYVISVPRADMELVQSTPVEIRKLDINTFRLWLKDWEDSVAGMTMPDVTANVAPIAVGGVQLARIVEILEPYTVTFEDGQYAVNLSGANTNLGDRVNVNQVSVRSANSAGLVQTDEIQYSSFNGGVTIDEANGVAGTVYPIGTPRKPVNNISDANLIAEYRGFDTFYIVGDAILGPGENLNNKIIIGQNPIKSKIIIEEGANTLSCELRNATVSGTLDGRTQITSCLIGDLTYVQGFIFECLLTGTMVMSGPETPQFLNCWSGVTGQNTPILDMGGTGRGLALRGYSGGIKIINKYGPEAMNLDITQGIVQFDASVTGGDVCVRGVAEVIDNSQGANVYCHSAINKKEIANSVWDAVVTEHVTAGSFGGFVKNSLLTVAKFLGLK